MRGTSADDDLLQPSLGQAPRAHDTSRPWRLGSQVYVAFFGGSIAVTAIALLNARRLRMDNRSVILIAAIGAVSFAASMLVVILADIRRADVRFVGRIGGLACYGLQYLVQRSADRVYGYHAADDEERPAYGSLLRPGLAAGVVGLALELLVLISVADR